MIQVTSFGIKNPNKIYKRKKFSFLMQKRGQITLFVIIGIVLVVAVVLFFVFRNNVVPNETGVTEESSSRVFLSECVEDHIQEIVDEVSLSGGKLNPQKSINFMFTDEGVYRNIAYLCYTPNYYESCVTQEVMIFDMVENEIKTPLEHGENGISPVESCFNDLVSDYQRQGYDVDSQYNGFDLSLLNNKIDLKLNGYIAYTKSGETSRQDNFEFFVPSHLYELIYVTEEIMGQEAEFCNFNNLGYTTIHQEYRIGIQDTSDGSKIYTVEYGDTGEKFRFAVRGCVLPPGF